MDSPSTTQGKQMSIAYNLGSVNGLDNPVVNIYVPSTMDVYIGVSESSQRPVDDIALLVQSSYEDAANSEDGANFTLLGTNEFDFNETRALSMDSLLENEDGRSYEDKGCLHREWR